MFGGPMYHERPNGIANACVRTGATAIKNVTKLNQRWGQVKSTDYWHKLWKKLWGGWSLPKVRFFIWCLLNHGFYTNAMGSHWQVNDGLCARCKVCYEHTKHLFSAVAKWLLGGQKWVICFKEPLPFKSHTTLSLMLLPVLFTGTSGNQAHWFWLWKCAVASGKRGMKPLTPNFLGDYLDGWSFGTLKLTWNRCWIFAGLWRKVNSLGRQLKNCNMCLLLGTILTVLLPFAKMKRQANLGRIRWPHPHTIVIVEGDGDRVYKQTRACWR